MNIGTHSHYTQGSVYISSYTHNSVMIYTGLLSSYAFCFHCYWGDPRYPPPNCVHTVKALWAISWESP